MCFSNDRSIVQHTSAVTTSNGSTKHIAPSDYKLDGIEQQQGPVKWYCCQCNGGPQSYELHKACSYCHNHIACQGCKFQNEVGLADTMFLRQSHEDYTLQTAKILVYAAPAITPPYGSPVAPTPIEGEVNYIWYCCCGGMDSAGALLATTPACLTCHKPPCERCKIAIVT